MLSDFLPICTRVYVPPSSTNTNEPQNQQERIVVLESEAELLKAEAAASLAASQESMNMDREEDIPAKPARRVRPANRSLINPRRRRCVLSLSLSL